MSRIHALSIAVIAALLTVAAMATFHQSGSKGDAAPVARGGAMLDANPYAGIPQDGLSLGRPDAPLTLVEFADLQCPFCRDYSVQVLPQIVDRYVRSGELRLELRVLRFLGPDSATAAAAAAAATQQNRLWQFADLFYKRQGAENSGYVTHDFLQDVEADSGVRGGAFARGMAAPPAERLARDAERHAQHLGVEGTPSFFIGPTGGALRPMPVSELEFGAFAAAIEAAR
jgi:protein-disulfide isomerase